jgi:hypothetical protein
MHAGSRATEVLLQKPELVALQNAIVYSDHVDPSFWDVDPPAKQAIRVRA